MNKNSLKSIHGLAYEDATQQSGLIKWYNRLIDKSVDDLDVVDVSKMIRQNILKDVAIDRAIELFLDEPFDGEMQDGDLLALLVSCGSEIITNRNISALISMVQKLENEFADFDWVDDGSRKLFESNLAALKKIINMEI